MASPKRKPEPEASKNKEAELSKAGEAGKGEMMPDESGYYEGLKVTAPEKRDGFGRAFIHVLVAAAVFGGALYLYWGKVQRDETVHNLAAEARSTYLRDNYRDLIEGERLLDEALELNSRHRYSIATKGLINAYLYYDHGLTDRLQVAEEFTRMAEERGAHLQERYGARALLLIAAGDFVEAERLMIEDVINEGGSGPAIFGSLGLAQRLLGKRTDARGVLQRAAEMERRSPRYNYWIAQMYFEGEDFSNTATFLDRALDVNPDHVLSLILQSRTQIARGDDVEAASRTLNEILERTDRELSPRARALALVGVAEHHQAEGRFDEAIASAEQSLELIADLADAHVIKGLAMVSAGRDGALETIRKGLDQFQYVPRAYHLAGKTMLEAERLDDARALMELWGERVTRNADYYIAFGNLLREGEDTEGAKARYERALELNPRAAEAHYHLGQMALANEELGDERISTAVEHFQEAIRVRERYPEVYEAMGWIFLEAREYGDALRQFVQAINFYQAQNAEREMLHELRRSIGEELRRHRQRRMSAMWLQESRDLIR